LPQRLSEPAASNAPAAATKRAMSTPSGWKVPVSQAWTSIRKGCPVLKGISRTTGVSEKQFLRYGLD
jgi:hypothetical protein